MGPTEGNILHLDPVGGIAGDMFVAALVDLYPFLEEPCLRAAESLDRRPSGLTAHFLDPGSRGPCGKCFEVTWDSAEVGGGLGFREVTKIVCGSGLTRSVEQRSLAILELIAESEGRIHGVEPGEVVFHEIGGWDSIVDIVLASVVIEAIGDVRWSCGPIPLGRGSVDTEHGMLPVPAPATADLLRGFDVFQDEFTGERVTPTGAAILRSLSAHQLAGLPLGKVYGFGTGYGKRVVPGLSNTLRVYELHAATPYVRDSVVVIEFDVDDQTPEDLAVGIEAIRACQGVLDVVQSPVYGKRGRLVAHVRLLAEKYALQAVVDTCLSATSSIGLRWHNVERAKLQRRTESVRLGNAEKQVKHVLRPDGSTTTKVEASDLYDTDYSFGEREAFRRQAYDRSKQTEDS